LRLQGVLILLGLALVVTRRWMVRDHTEYLRRMFRDTRFHRTYLRFYETWPKRAERVHVIVGTLLILLGLLFLVR
jgi:RsiW-degrading membrane proteinase PrsW (M82 family)